MLIILKWRCDFCKSLLECFPIKVDVRMTLIIFCYGMLLKWRRNSERACVQWAKILQPQWWIYWETLRNILRNITWGPKTAVKMRRSQTVQTFNFVFTATCRTYADWYFQEIWCFWTKNLFCQQKNFLTTSTLMITEMHYCAQQLLKSCSESKNYY